MRAPGATAGSSSGRLERAERARVAARLAALIGRRAVAAGRERRAPSIRRSVSVMLAAIVGFACGGPHPAGAPPEVLCLAVEDCFPEIDHALLGTVFCEDKFAGGYCTHTCETDEDCCAIEGECAPEIAQVCTPLADDETQRCWVSCEDDALGGADPTTYCRMHTGSGTGCRSSSGGSENRDICAPP